jgi:hypothetical protein
VTNSDKVFNIIPMSSSAFGFIVVLFLAIMAIPIVVLFAEPSSWAGALVSGIVCILVLGVLASFLYQGKQATFSLGDKGLTIRPGIYGRTILKSDIIIEAVRVIDLNYERPYQARWRRNGAGLPGYLSGWFSLQNGEKALMFVTNRSSVVYIPTRKNYVVLLSVQQADEMVSALQRWGK